METKFLDAGSLNRLFTFTVNTTGIYFAGATAPTYMSAPLKRRSFADGKILELGLFDKRLFLQINVSPGENWLLYTQIASSTDDIMLVENFRRWLGKHQQAERLGREDFVEFVGVHESNSPTLQLIRIRSL